MSKDIIPVSYSNKSSFVECDTRGSMNEKPSKENSSFIYDYEKSSQKSQFIPLRSNEKNPAKRLIPNTKRTIPGEDKSPHVAFGD